MRLPPPQRAGEDSERTTMMKRRRTMMTLRVMRGTMTRTMATGATDTEDR